MSNNQKYIAVASSAGSFKTTSSTLTSEGCVELRSCSTSIPFCQSLWNVLELCEGCRSSGSYKLLPTENAPSCSQANCPALYVLSYNRSCQPTITGRTSCTGAFFYNFPTNSCVACSANCSSCVGNVKGCSACANGFYLKEGECVNNCTVDLSADLNTVTARCTPAIATGILSCDNWSSNGKQCLSSCPSGSSQKNNVCVTCPQNCSQCLKKPNECTLCRAGLNLQQGQCVA